MNELRSWIAGGLAVAALAATLSGCRVAPSAPEDLSARGQLRLLEMEVEGAPIYDSSLRWLPVYERMIAVGFEPRQARRNTRRAAHYGPNAARISEVIEAHRDDLEALQAALDQEHRLALDDRYAAPPVIGYQHPPRDRVEGTQAGSVLPPPTEAPAPTAPGLTTEPAATPPEGLPGEPLPGDELPGEPLPGDELPGDELPGDELPPADSLPPVESESGFPPVESPAPGN